jgi:hypothetical protein
LQLVYNCSSLPLHPGPGKPFTANGFSLSSNGD